METSAIILNYNSSNSTIKLIKSLKRVSKFKLRYIVVDNHSSVEEVSILKSDDSLNDCHLIFLEENIGFAAGNNVGINYAQSNGADIIFIMNPDIELSEDIFYPISYAFEANKKLGVCGPVQMIGPKEYVYGANIRIGKVNSTPQLKSKKFDRNNRLLYVDSVVGACFAVRSSSIEKVGLIPQDYFLNFEETDWCLNFTEAGFKVAVFEGALIKHNEHGSISKVSGLQRYYMLRNNVVFNLKHLSRMRGLMFVLQTVIFETLHCVHHLEKPNFGAIVDGYFRRDKYGHFVGKKDKGM